MNKDAVFEAVIKSDLLETILDLFKSYEWNNMLHNQVEKIIMTILEGNHKGIREFVTYNITTPFS